MVRVKYSHICLGTAITVFSIVAKLLFDRVYLTANLVIDEEFHLSLGKAYCNFDFIKWHPKVTTLPGLYLLSSLLLGPFSLCSIYWLRFISLVFSIVNIALFYSLLGLTNDDPPWKNVISAINIALLPPLFFFSHLYYTDVTSLTTILLLFIFSKRGNHYLASIFGMLSILFRQTNIVWVGMVFGSYILKELSAARQNKPKITGMTSMELMELLKVVPANLMLTLKKTTLNFWLNLMAYASLLLCFLLFVVVNGSIVVGDKVAHEVTINIPQIFYFSFFCLVFAWQIFIGEIVNFCKFVRNKKFITVVAMTLCLLIVHFNTVVHPYLLADNRHYVFYVWNRFYEKYALFRYAVVPLYVFSLFVIVTKLYDRKDVTFLLFFIPCTLTVLTTQRLLEFRYFFVPYVLFRTQIKKPSSSSLLGEFLTFILLNAVTLYLFFTKTIYWVNFDYPQRLIW